MPETELPLRFAECTWTDLDALDRASAVLLLPVGSTEAHGPHLPLATDAIISEEMALRAARSLRARGLTALVLPTIAYAVTEFAGSFAGSLSIRPETASAVIEDVCRSAVAQGFARISIANSHLEPDHVATITRAAAAVRDATGVAVSFPDKRRRRWASMLTEEFRSGACHAGSYESSVVMCARPELVREATRLALRPVEISLSDAIRDGKRTFAEIGGDRAYFGRPADASAAEGDATLDKLASMLVADLEETYGLADGV
jgi:creatinine amidohydrolase